MSPNHAPQLAPTPLRRRKAIRPVGEAIEADREAKRQASIERCVVRTMKYALQLNGVHGRITGGGI